MKVYSSQLPLNASGFVLIVFILLLIIEIEGWIIEIFILVFTLFISFNEKFKFFCIDFEEIWSWIEILLFGLWKIVFKTDWPSLSRFMGDSKFSSFSESNASEFWLCLLFILILFFEILFHNLF